MQPRRQYPRDDARNRPTNGECAVKRWRTGDHSNRNVSHHRIGFEKRRVHEHDDKRGKGGKNLSTTNQRGESQSQQRPGEYDEISHSTRDPSRGEGSSAGSINAIGRDVADIVPGIPHCPERHARERREHQLLRQHDLSEGNPTAGEHSRSGDEQVWRTHEPQDRHHWPRTSS